MQAQNLKRACINGNNIVIFWNPLYDTCEQFIEYNIFARESASSSFISVAVIKTNNDSSYTHINARLFSTSWEYFIITKYYCSGIKTIFSDTIMTDIKPPGNIEIDSISVINGKIVIGWQKSKDSDIKGYLIYYDSFGFTKLISFVPGKENTFFVDSSMHSPVGIVHYYRIAVIDSCDNISLISEPHNTLFINYSMNFCKNELMVSWMQPYKAWSNASTEYQLWVAGDTGSYNIKNKVNGFQNLIRTSDLKDETNYRLIIRAKNLVSGITASSNELKIKTDFIDLPDTIYLSNVSVEENKIKVKWILTKNSDLSKFIIFRSEDKKTFFAIDSMPFFNGIFSYEYSDETANLNKYSYTYYVTARDLCGQVIKQSNKSSNILLNIYEDRDNHYLTWNRYLYWSGGLKKQKILEQINDAGQWNLKSSMEGTYNKYSAGLNVDEMKGKFLCFRLEAEEGDTNVFGIKEKSYSNDVCIYGDPLVFIPNAFVPFSEKYDNQYFKPTGLVVDWEKSKLQVFDRWGEKLFDGNPEVGWDGKFKGQDVPGGVYFYISDLVGKNGKKIHKTGTINLIR